MLFGYAERAQAYAAYLKLLAGGERAYLLCDNSVAEEFHPKNVLNLGKTEEEIASNLYDKLREGELCADVIVAVAPLKEDGIMAGVLNRLKKACG